MPPLPSPASSSRKGIDDGLAQRRGGWCDTSGSGANHVAMQKSAMSRRQDQKPGASRMVRATTERHRPNASHAAVR